MSAAFKYLDPADLPEEWTAGHFGNLVDFNLGRTPPRASPIYWKGGKYPWVSISDMTPNGVITDTAEKVSQQAHDSIFRGKLVPEGSLLMSFKLTIGRMSRLGIPAFHNEAIISFQPNSEEISPEYLSYYLSQINFKDYQDTAIKGQTLNKGKLNSLEIALPPLPEQKKIAHILSTVQRAIEAQERIIQTTTELKKALMHKLFTEGLRNEPQKQTEIGPVPESWEVRKLGDIASTISKGSSPKWQGFQYTESGILFVRSQNVGSGKMLFDDRAYLPASFNEKEKRSILQSGDILINLVGASIGRVALGTDDIEGGNCNQAVGFVRLDGTEELKQLIVYFLLSPWGQEQMRRQKKDIARANLSLLDVRGFEIPIPSTEEEIEEIARALVIVEEKAAMHERKRDQLQDLFRTLLHELMTAKTRVHELELSA